MMRAGLIRQLAAGLYNYLPWAGEPCGKSNRSFEKKWTRRRDRSTDAHPATGYALETVGTLGRHGSRIDEA
jgi:hypothetical protein